jgi:DNA-binding MarR family transcriptional regulator
MQSRIEQEAEKRLGNNPAMQVAAGLSRIGMLLKQHAVRGAGSNGVSALQAQILTLLQGSGAGKSPTLNWIAQTLAVTPATASEAVSSLVAKGLLQRERSQGDKRMLELSLGPAGLLLARQLMGWPDALLEAVDGMDCSEQAALLRLLSRMIRDLQLRGEIPVQRMCVTCRYFRPWAHPEGVHQHHCGFVDAAFGGAALRLDCPEHESAAEPDAAHSWQHFMAGSRETK